jgi:predicted negative regulator of RcsB-dependent stress response
MAFYDLEEQEQLAALKAWWKQWGPIVVLAIALALAGIAGYQIWSWHKGKQSAKAGDLYGSVTKALREGNVQKARDNAKELVSSYPGSGYAPLAALSAARLAFEARDLADAKQQLQWVVDKAKDNEFKVVARLRLAAVLLDEKQYDEALKLLEPRPEDAMTHLLADLRGDAYVAKGALAEARTAYLAALEKTDIKSPYRNLIQIKLDALGSPK